MTRDERNALVARCAHVLCPEVLTSFCVWKAIPLARSWDEYSLSRIGKLVRHDRIAPFALDRRDPLFRNPLDRREFPAFELVRRRGLLWHDARFRRPALQYLVYAERYLLWAQAARPSATAAHHLALVYVDACRAAHLSPRAAAFGAESGSGGHASPDTAAAESSGGASPGSMRGGGEGASNADADGASTRGSSGASEAYEPMKAFMESSAPARLYIYIAY